MRLWSLHPKYLDNIGLVALWREALLAKKVIQGKTKGYKNHPQLERFKKTRNPLSSIKNYLKQIFLESKKRGLSFDKRKIGQVEKSEKIFVNNGQLKYEFYLLCKKLKKRCPKRLNVLKGKKIIPNPIFKIKKGSIEYWERL